MREVVIKRTASACCVLLLLFWVSLSISSAGGLKEIQEAIEVKNAGWIAGETAISRLPPEEIKRRMGTIIIEQAETEIIPLIGRLPGQFDWRDNGGNWVTPVKDQGDCGSCWAFGAVGALESLVRITQGNPGFPVDLSEQFLVSCCRRNLGCDGGYMDTTYNYLKRRGAPSEECFPYQALELPCFLHCKKWRPEALKIDTWQWVAQDAEALKNAVLENPVTCAYNVYEDFMYYAGGVYEYVEGDLVGGHAVLIVGWDDNPPEGIPCFICKNSWGTNWGEAGYFRIGQSQVTNLVSFGSNAGDFDILH